MKRPIIHIALAVALTGGVLLWGAAGIVPAASAADERPHAGHDHAEHDHDSHAEEEVEDLFGEDGEEGHDDHAGHGHDDAEHAGDDDHAGHDHGGSGLCPEHEVPEVEDALCHGDHLGDLQPGEGMLVRLASPEVAARAGVRLSAPQHVSLADGVDVPGRAAFNRERLARLTPPASAVVRRVAVRPGARVAQGAVLAELAMPEVAVLNGELVAARARLAQAEAAHLRERDLLERGITSRQEFQQAEAEQRAARGAVQRYRRQLLGLGLSEADLGRQDGSTVPLRAPFAGTVVAVEAAPGEAAAPGDPLVTVAALDTLWVELSLPESRIHLARVGAPIEARFDGLPGAVFSGSVFQVGAQVDARTRTLAALAEVRNPDERLRAGMFGTVRLLFGAGSRVLAVPADALQRIDGLAFVFVQRQADLFELRRVQAGVQREGLVPVLAGLAAGEEVVSSQGFALKSEVLKARLGASCADH